MHRSRRPPRSNWLGMKTVGRGTNWGSIAAGPGVRLNICVLWRLGSVCDERACQWRSVRRALLCALALRPRSGLDQKDHTEGYSLKFQHMRFENRFHERFIKSRRWTIANQFGGIRISPSNWKSRQPKIVDSYDLNGNVRRRPTGFSAIAIG